MNRQVLNIKLAGNRTEICGGFASIIDFVSIGCFRSRGVKAEAVIVSSPGVAIDLNIISSSRQSLQVQAFVIAHASRTGDNRTR